MLPLVLAMALLTQNEPATPDDAGPPDVRQRIDLSLAFLAKEGLEWETKSCVSCHHGPWMMWSGYEAKRRGFAVNDESLQTVRSGALKAYLGHPKMQPTSRDLLNVWSINVTYLTFGLGAAGEPDAETVRFFDRAAAHLVESQKEDGSWKVSIKNTPQGRMAPLIDGDDVTTMWALLTLNYREPAGISKETLDQCKARGLKFLSDNPPDDALQSLVLRIMLNQRLGKADEVQALVTQLLARQKEDGGWSQAGKLRPDALGTGQVLVALTTAGLSIDHPAFVKAREFLLKTQLPNGSWEVISRAYEGPKFSSYMGTAWATIGLVRLLPADAPVRTAMGESR